MIRYSIIIPCFNESHVLKKTMGRLQAVIGDRSDVEVILVDNGSTDDSRDIAANLGVRVIPRRRVHISELRNVGAADACGKALLFLDADVLVDPGWLQNIDDYFFPGDPDGPRADAVGFVDLAPENAPWFARAWARGSAARRQTVRRTDNLPGRNLAVSRNWFDRVGGFDADLETGEDKDFVMRLSKAGARVLTDPSLRTIHLGYERTFGEWCRKEYWRQSSLVDVVRRQGVTLRLLRFPLLCAAHWAAIGFCLVALIVGGIGPALLLCALTWIPSLAIALRYAQLLRDPSAFLPLAALYWLRFFIAGYAIAMDTTRRFVRAARPQRGG